MPRQPPFVGDPALIVVDIQRGSAAPGAESGIPRMPGALGRIARAERLVAAAREARVPVISTEARHLASLDAMEYLQAGARRSTQEIIDAFAALAAGRALTPTGAEL